MRWELPTGIVVLALGCVLGGYRLGRGHAPPAEVRTVTVDKVVYQDRVEYRDRVAVQAARAQVIRRVIHVTVAPDGTTTRDVTVDKATNASQSAQADAQGQRTKSAEEFHGVSSTAVLRAPWAFAAMGGLNAAAVVGADRRWWIGGSMTHSFLGPLRLGLVVVKGQDQPMQLGVVMEVER